MNIFVFDLEGDGLLDEITKIHCICYEQDGLVRNLSTYDSMRTWVANADVLIGHNIQRFDIPAIEKILKVKVKAQLVDTLMLSWYLEPDRVKHGLEEWGVEFGIPKPVIHDWRNLSLDEYIHRCSEDVRINTKLWKRFRSHLTRIYGGWEEVKPFLKYLEAKMDTAVEQERSGWAFDKDYALQSLQKLTEAREEKLGRLVAAMPKTPVYATRRRPAKPFKKDGTYSVSGARWFALLKQLDFPKDYKDEIKEQIGEEEPNPNSSIQIKNWLYDLGWKPQTYKYQRNKDTGELRKIPQVNLEHGGGLCPSVIKLIDIEPNISALDELGVVNHRISIINGFLAFAGSGGNVQAQVGGLTNTLRWKHRVCVNLPKVGKPWGEEIRGCLIAQEDHELCGSDMSSLEDRLKQHFIYPHDPAYVEEMNQDDYDPHLSLALLANEVTEAEVNEYKLGISKKIKPIRDIFKNGNYACQYGAGAARLALTADIPLKKAEQVWKVYWEKNWAIKVVADEQKIKRVKGQMWLYNPISGFWYHLKVEKDVFSTLVQGSASFVFDKWVELFRSRRPQITGQFHDEVILCIKKGHRKECEKLLRTAIEELNSILKLNRDLAVDVDFGSRYSEIH